MQFDESGPNTHTRRYRVGATVGIGAMAVFALLSILLLLGVLFGSASIKALADSLFPWSLLVFAAAGVAMWQTRGAGARTKRSRGPGHVRPGGAQACGLH